MTNKIFLFEQLRDAPLVIDAIYKAGTANNYSDEPISKLIPSIPNARGFRYTKKNNSTDIAYVVLYSTGSEIEWPDTLDSSTGVFTYYGDNRDPGHEIGSKRGNRLLEKTFALSQNSFTRGRVPPFFIFQKTGNKRDVKFLGLAVPGNRSINVEEWLVAKWRSKEGQRFQNYLATFTVLDTGSEAISKEWLIDLKKNTVDSYTKTPRAWKQYVKSGIGNITPLAAESVRKYRKKTEQLPNNKDGMKIIGEIYAFFKDPFKFEKFAVEIVKMLDENFTDFDLTRPWRDGGRDAVGHYRIGPPTGKLPIECALEAKRYKLSSGVGVKETARLIARIKYRQFGILVTSSYLSEQAYKELYEDGHPVLVICAKDIVEILIKRGVSVKNIKEWLSSTFDS